MYNYRTASAQPKHKRIKLEGKAKTKLRRDLHKRAKGQCESCGRHLPFYVFDYAGEPYFDEFRCGHTSHIISRGAGGDDSMENCLYECWDCHRGKHNGKL